jgi:hypothetical protein
LKYCYEYHFTKAGDPGKVFIEAMSSLILFFALQILDAATTLVFLRLGVSEANPIVRFVLGLRASPIVSLALLKIAGCGIAVAAWRLGRTRLLGRVNAVFAACVAWNVVAIFGAR